MNPLVLATSTTVDLNQKSQSLGDCLKEVSNIGYKSYQNICTGQQVVVHWGSADWFLIIFFGSVILMGVIALCQILHDVY